MESDFLVIGGGIIGMSVARELRSRFPQSSITLLEKETQVGLHASGRNSGVLHAGFYYTADSLKARLTQAGNKAWKSFCRDRRLYLNETGKLVVAKDASQKTAIEELFKRGGLNGVPLEWVEGRALAAKDPNARSYGPALWSPTTATVDPVEVCLELRRELEESKVRILTGTPFQSARMKAQVIFNCAGLYADRIAREFGFSKNYTILPFRGMYWKHSGAIKPVQTNIYPVPDLRNPFLGVHFTVTAKGDVKIGPTATPALWRENYRGLSRFSPKDFLEVGASLSKLWVKDSFHFRALAREERKKSNRQYFLNLAQALVHALDPRQFTTPGRPGIRAQLLDRRNSTLVQDFVVEGDSQSVHVLNAVSPAFTCALPFASHVVDQWQTWQRQAWATGKAPDDAVAPHATSLPQDYSTHPPLRSQS